MSDKEKAFAVLHIASQTCSGALKALRDPTTIVAAPEVDTDASLDTRLNDYTSLLSLLHQNATKLAIALKPCDLTYTAAISPAKELAMHADALASCAYSIDETGHGRTLACEVRWSAEEVLSALESLLGVYTANAHRQGGRAGTGAGEPYLVRTGVVHETIDRARGISRTNQEAVRKRWEGVLGGLSDCEKEVQEMIEEEEKGRDDEEGSEDEGPDDFDEDDGWGELGDVPLSTKGNIKASQEELAHLKSNPFLQAHTLFKFTHALLKRVDLIILRPSSSIASPPPETLDKLLSSSDTLLKAADELVNALYIPQAREALSDRAQAFVALVDELRAGVSFVGLVTHITEGQDDNDAITDLSQRTASVKLEAPSDEEKKMAKERKWFDTCFTHISKSAAGLA